MLPSPAALMATASPDRPLRVAFRVDASPRIGGGHVMRCLTLAQELARHGARITFISAAMIPSMRVLVEAAGFDLVTIDLADTGSDEADWDKASWSEEAQRADAEACAGVLGGGGFSWLVVDHYGLDAAWERAAGAHAGAVAVIDDLANRPHDCALLLDQTFGRDPADYRPLTGAATELLIGAHYALLRPDFAAARPAALDRHLSPGPVRRLLISLGTSDVGGLTEIATRAALAATDARIDVVLGSAAPTLERIRALAEAEPRLTLHVDTEAMCALMTSADLAIGAAGSTSWERCCLGLPAITVAVADNQRLIAAKLAEAGAIMILDPPTESGFAEALKQLAGDEAARLRLARASADVCDGEGAGRVAGAMLARGRDA